MIPIRFAQISSTQVGTNHPLYVAQTPTGVLVLVFGSGSLALAHVDGVVLAEEGGRFGLALPVTLDLEKIDCEILRSGPHGETCAPIADGKCCACGQESEDPITCRFAASKMTHCRHWFWHEVEKEDPK